MKHEVIGKLAGWAALAAMAVLATMMSVGRAGLPEAEPLPLGASCDAPAPGAATLQGQIRYDSGVVLRYCSLAAMFTQLGAQEQPGMVRSAMVLAGDGRWLDARHVRYETRGRGAPALAAGEHGLSYNQLLQACGRNACPATYTQLVTKD